MTSDRGTGTTTVACLYYELRESVESNRERLVAGIEDALARADLVVGPETATIGIELDPPEVAANAESLAGETVSRAREAVEREGGIAVFGIPERADGERYNTCVLLEAGCEPRAYRQREYEYTHGWTTAHGGHRVFETALGRVAPLVCADLGFSDTRECLADADPAFVLAPANWGEDDRLPPLLDRWSTWSDAIPCPIAISNAYAPAWRSDRGFAFDGPSAILAHGDVLAWTDEPGETIVADI